MLPWYLLLLPRCPPEPQRHLHFLHASVILPCQPGLWLPRGTALSTGKPGSGGRGCQALPLPLLSPAGRQVGETCWLVSLPGVH